MAFVHDASGNFPQQYDHCPKCGMKGLYSVGPSITGQRPNGTPIFAHHGYTRCKYCGEADYRDAKAREG
jgi:DNA-directed RNA polymerase subunit RPC12/RpoP